MPKGSFVRAGIVSLVLAALFPLIYVWALGGGIEYEPPPGAPETFHRMSYEEQEAWLKSHSVQVSGTKALMNRILHPGFWKTEYLQFALPLFLVLFVACVTAIAWERKTSSNKLSEPTP